MLPFFPTIIPAQAVVSPPPVVSAVVDGSIAIPIDGLLPPVDETSLENLQTTISPSSLTLADSSINTTPRPNLNFLPPNFSTTSPSNTPSNFPSNSPSNSQIIVSTPPPTTAGTTLTPLPSFLPSLTPTLPPIVPRVVIQRHEVRPLPGQLNQIPVLNSNSPEEVFGDGILLSTFPPGGKRSPQAHLNLTLDGRFDVFAHHIARTANREFGRPLYLGVLLYNPNSRVVIVDVMQAVTYFTNPDAPFMELPDYVDNFSGNTFSGPGSRLAADVLRGVHQQRFPNQIILFPGESRMLMNEPVLIGSAVSSLMRLRSNGPVYVASLSLVAPIVPPPPEPPPPPIVRTVVTGVPGAIVPRPTPSPLPPPRPVYRSPTISEWEDLLRNGSLASPRDSVPTPPNRSVDSVIYGRVAGIALGNLWQGQLVDSPSSQELSIPNQGGAVSYAINTLSRGTLGTSQDQSAPIIARYPDTAYRANGNYGIQYSLSLPLYNGTGQTQTVSIALQTPLKRDDNSQGLQFLDPPPNNVNDVFFRGTVQIAYQDDFGLPRTRAVHVVQRRGQQGEPLITLRMPPGNRRLVTVDLIYPPDATPPQVLTIRTTNPVTTLLNQGELPPSASRGESPSSEDLGNLNSSNQNPLSEVLANQVVNQATNLEINHVGNPKINP